MMRELSRSTDSSRTNSRELLEVVLHKKDEDDRHHPHHHQQQSDHHTALRTQHLQQLHQSRSNDSSRLSAMLLRTTHLGLNQNHTLGDLSRGPSSFSRKSLSRQSLDSNSRVSDVCEPRDQRGRHSWTLCGGIDTFLNTLGLLSIASLVLAVMGLMLLAVVSQGDSTAINSARDSMDVRTKGDNNDEGDNGSANGNHKLAQGKTQVDPLSGELGELGSLTMSVSTRAPLAVPQNPASDGSGSATDSGSRPRLLDAAVAMATVVVVTDMCCLMVCSIQCFFAAKLLKTYEGGERSAKYLRECSSSRFIAVMGFFLSIPAFLVAMVLTMLLKLTPGPALTSCVMLGTGMLFCILSVMQNVYHWRVEKSRAEEGLPVYDRHLLSGTHPLPPLQPLQPMPPPTILSPAQPEELSTLV